MGWRCHGCGQVGHQIIDCPQKLTTGVDEDNLSFHEAMAAVEEEEIPTPTQSSGSSPSSPANSPSKVKNAVKSQKSTTKGRNGDKNSVTLNTPMRQAGGSRTVVAHSPPTPTEQLNTRHKMARDDPADNRPP